MTNDKNIWGTSRIPILVLSLLVAFFADVKCINWALVYGGFVNEGVMNTIYPILIALIIAFASFTSIRKIKKKRSYHFFFCATLLFFYFVTNSLCGSPRSPLALFCGFTIFAFLVPNICMVDAKTVLKAMMFYPIFAITRIDLVFQTVTEWQDFVNMDASYGFLIPVIANIVYLLYFFKEENKKSKIVTILLSLVNSAYLLRLLIFGSRGVVFSLFLFGIFFWISDVKKEGGIQWNHIRLKYAIAFIVILMFSYLSFFSFLSDIIYDVFGHKFYAIDKIVELGSQGKMSNGRDAVSEVCIDGILSSPIWGNGIDRFGPNTNMAYPHNFILQILYDGGLCLFFFMFIPTVKALMYKMRTIKREELALLTSFFFASVPGALFSSDMYDVPLLWMSFGFILTNGFVKENI